MWIGRACECVGKAFSQGGPLVFVQDADAHLPLGRVVFDPGDGELAGWSPLKSGVHFEWQTCCFGCRGFKLLPDSSVPSPDVNQGLVMSVGAHPGDDRIACIVQQERRTFVAAHDGAVDIGSAPELPISATPSI